MLSDSALVLSVRAASSLSKLTPALGLADEPDTVVCDHLVELKSTNGRSLEGAVRVCAWCGELEPTVSVHGKEGSSHGATGPVRSVATLTPAVLDRETARAQLIELFYASLPEAEIGRAINLLGVVMP